MKESPAKKYMRLALKEARKNLLDPQGGPFGACIIKGGRVLAKARNTVLKNDATAHAEINAIRKACLLLKTHNLAGCRIYSTTEPCPMCFSALHWAKIDAVVYGTTIVDVHKLGFNELVVSSATLKHLGKSKVKILPGFLKNECKDLLKEWGLGERKAVY